MLHTILFSTLCCVCLVLLPRVCSGWAPSDHMVYDDHHDHDHGIDSRIMEDHHEGDINQGIRMDDFRRDVEHLREHMRGQVNVEDINPATATKEELDWHFFNIHDTDDDMRLDGLELLQALGHALHHQLEAMMQRQGVDPEQIKQRIERTNIQFVKQIDKILDEEDLDQDGYLNYHEYAKARSAQRMIKQADIVQKTGGPGWY